MPTNQYAAGANTTASEIIQLEKECKTFSERYPPNVINSSSGRLKYTINGSTYTAIFAIGSSQKSIFSGGSVILFGNLTVNNAGLAGQTIYFYLNSTTYIGSVVTSNKGQVYANLTIPYVYVPEAVIWGYAKNNATSGFPGLVSNSLYFQIVYNQTQIVFNAPG